VDNGGPAMQIKYSARTGVTKIKSRFANTKRTLALGIAGAGLTVALPIAAFALGGPQANSTVCSGKQVVNVTYTLYNDLDSGLAGNNWANDTLNRHLQIWQNGTTFCAAVSDNGNFVTINGPSPGNTGQVPNGLTGVINGGYTTGDYPSSFTSQNYSTKGNLGSFDANETHPSILSYTPDWAFSQPSWGWQYHTAKNGDWTNASAGTHGDIKQ
jgi:hypothetical protein